MMGMQRESISGRVSRRQFIAGCAAMACLPTVGCAAFGGFFAPSPAATHDAADKATRGVMKELERAMKANPDKKPTLCFIGVTGGSCAADLSSMTRDILEGGSFKLIKKSDTQDALKESGVRPNNVFIPKERAKFVDALGTDVDYLLAGYVEKASDGDDDSASGDDNFQTSHGKRMVYKLELVEVKTNRKSEFIGDL